MNCSRCNKEIPIGKKFCSYCGAPVAQMRFCKKCGSSLDPNAKFCKVCGTPVIQTLSKSGVTSAPPVQNVGSEPIHNSPRPESSIKSAETQVNQPFITNEPKPANPIPPGNGSQINSATKSVFPTTNTEQVLESQAIETVLPVYEQEHRGKSNIWVFLIIALVVIVGGGGFAYWKFFSKTTEKEDMTEVVEASGEVNQNDGDLNEGISKAKDESDVKNSSEEVASNEMRFPYFNTYLAYDTNSSEVYDSYRENDITNESLGDNWKSTPHIINSRDEVAYNMNATGTINGNDIRFEAVMHGNGRIYGRYNHSNGTKLDVNGIIDREGNIIIKLGHGSATSYWVLHPKNEENNVVYYEGTWGKKDSPSTLICVYSKSVEKASASTRRTLSGALIADDGKRYPFKLSFDKIGDEIANAEYENADYHTKAKLTTAHLSNGEYYFSGKLGNDQLTIRFSTSYPYEGKMISGNKVGDIQMNL